MAIGDATIAAGWPIVPDTGEDGRVRHGAREINRTRDFVAVTSNRIPTTKSGFRIASGITAGTAAPSGGSDGDIYFRYV